MRMSRSPALMVLLGFVLVYLHSTLSFDSKDPIVDTQLGQIRGIEQTIDGRKLYAFRGIPYARAPLGVLRFRKPEGIYSFNGTLDASKYGPACLQHRYPSIDLPHGDMSEDCLYLNIYVPRTLDSNASKSVMFWIHGGVFLNGQGSEFNGTLLSMRGDVIVVTINYRLSVFGFLSTNDSASPGNYGLWDQRMALQWVRSHISSFGGNPSSITLFGQSSGATSVYLHTESEQSRSLFQRGILQSGYGYINKQSSDVSRRVAFGVAAALQCTNSTDNFVTNTYDVMDCLREKPAHEIQQATSVYILAHDNNITNTTLTPVFGVVLDGDFLSRWPDMKEDDSDKMEHTIDILAGFNDDEGGLIYYHLVILQYVYGYDVRTGVPEEILCEIYAPSIANQYYSGDANVIDAICKEYTKRSWDQMIQAQNTINVIRDHLYTARTVAALRSHSTHMNTTCSTYMYVFAHHPETPDTTLGRSPWLHGANHADEIEFVFGVRGAQTEGFSDDKSEERLSEQMMDYWTNFAKNG